MNRPPSPAFTANQRIALALVPPLVVFMLYLLCATLRFQTLADPEARPADESTTDGLYAFWHGTLLLAAFRYRDLGIHILISPSFDGELIARIVARLGFVPVRGSSSRGGAAGLLALTRVLQQGGKVAITVDGPRGPRHLAKPGAAAIALHAGNAPISPFHLQPSRAWSLRSWDRLLIPKPFAHVRCLWSTSVLPLPGETVPALTARLQACLDRAAENAETLH